MPTDVWAFDFDGVVCDSVGESSLSAWKAALKKWPEVFGTPEAQAKRDFVLESMRIVRPVVETGCAARCRAAPRSDDTLYEARRPTRYIEISVLGIEDVGGMW